MAWVRDNECTNEDIKNQVEQLGNKMNSVIEPLMTRAMKMMIQMMKISLQVCDNHWNKH